jgi:hypothetical protein
MYGFLMITEEDLIQEFLTVMNDFYPSLGKMLHHCYVKIITSHWGQPPKRLRYIAIYCPEETIATIQSRKDALREVAHNMGLGEVICINVNRLLRDPMSKLKHTEPRFWLELHWLLTQGQ